MTSNERKNQSPGTRRVAGRIGGAERDLGNVARACELFRQSDTAFQSTSPSVYLRETGVSVQQALARCQGASVAVPRAR